MKKTMAVLLAMVLVFALLGGCANNADTSAPADSNSNAEPSSDASGNQGTDASTEPAAAGTGFDFAGSDKITFGCLTYLTGNNMEQGERSKAVIDYAVEQINANGGVLGKQLEVLYFDSGNDQQTVLNSVSKILATEGMSGFFGCMYSNDTLAYLPSITEAQMPAITAGNSGNVILENNPFCWMPRIDDGTLSSMLAKLAVEELGMKNPAILYMSNATGQGVHDKVVEVLATYDITPALEISFDNMNTSNYTPIATQLVNSGADGVILSANSADPSGVLATTAIMQAGFEGPKVTVPALFRNDTIEQAKGALNGWYGLAEFDVSSSDPVIASVVQGMAAKNPDLAPTWIEAVFYDSLMMFVEAAELAGSSEPVKINEGMAMLKDYEGMMGLHSYRPGQSTPNGIYKAHIENDTIIFGEYMTR